MENDPLQLDSTEAGVSLQLFPGDPPGPFVLSFSHLQYTRHPEDDEAEVSF